MERGHIGLLHAKETLLSVFDLLMIRRIEMTQLLSFGVHTLSLVGGA